ncbi:MAG: hypothetical protein JXX28_08870 [Deltaproteobacteria bacterium]|nr:hypothetical protein [Deltaproteobacteria bacterium]
MASERIKIGPEVRFSGPEGVSLTAEDVSMEVRYHGETPTELLLHLSVPWETWEQIDRGAWFHLEPEHRGGTFSGALDPEKRVELELALDSDELTTLALLTEDYWEMGGLIRGDNLDRSFKRQSSWYAHNVKQALGPIKVGFATTWSGLL